MSGTVGIFGIGKLGTALARLALASGRRVLVTGSPRQHAVALVVSVLLPGAEVVPAEQLAREADVVVLAVPWGKAGTLPWPLLSGKVVVDAMNYWAPVDGQLAWVEADPRSTSEQVAALHPEARLVKSLNQLGYHELEAEARPAGARRRAVALASDDEDAKRAVAELVTDLGFEPVDAGALAMGRLLEPGRPFFGAEVDADAMRELLEEARGD